MLNNRDENWLYRFSIELYTFGKKLSVELHVLKPLDSLVGKVIIGSNHNNMLPTSLFPNNNICNASFHPSLIFIRNIGRYTHGYYETSPSFKPFVSTNILELTLPYRYNASPPRIILHLRTPSFSFPH